MAVQRPSILNTLERKFILFVGDLLIVLASLNVLVNHAIDSQYISLTLKLWVFSVGVAMYFLLAYILDFYNLEKSTKRIFIVTQSFYITGTFVFSIFVFTILVFDVSFWRIPLIVFLILTPFAVGLWRFLFSNIFQLIPVTKNVLYLYDDVAKKTLREDTQTINGKEMETFYRVKLTHHLDSNSEEIRKKFINAAEKVDCIIVKISDYDELPVLFENLLYNSIIIGREVISFKAFYENTYEAMPLRYHNDSFYDILQFRNRRIRYLHRIFSFGINFLLSLLVGLIFLILLPVVFILNTFLNKGPLFYIQKRVGRYNKEFKIYKFRSMIVDAEKTGAIMASKNDKRITPFGKILREFRIDELPQILSVIRGDMQFIGPRPERRVFVDQLNEILPYYSVRHLIKPGITGWAQVKYKYGENLEDSVRKLEYDLYYIKNKSITLDLRIILKTITTVLFSRGI